MLVFPPNFQTMQDCAHLYAFEQKLSSSDDYLVTTGVLQPAAKQLSWPLRTVPSAPFPHTLPLPSAAQVWP